jgi:hypothetical protein
MQSRTRNTSSLIAAALLLTALNTADGQGAKAVREPDAGFTASSIAGLYQMLDPRGYADPLAAAAYLRLLPDGRSRLEGVVVSDVNGSINSRTEIGSFHRTPWAISPTAAGPELCFDVAGKSHCEQIERDLATSDLLLYDPARPRGRPDLRLHRVGAPPGRTTTE